MHRHRDATVRIWQHLDRHVVAADRDDVALRQLAERKADDFFIVVDGIRVRTPGYFTFANLSAKRDFLRLAVAL
jgi:hypothetical protein